MSTATRVVLYGRTSHDVSEGRSVDSQLAELRHWADATGREVVTELRDDGIGASRHSRHRVRPGWQRVLDLVADRGVDELAVWEVSRSTRDRAVWSALIASCIEHDVRLAVGGKVHDPADPDDGFMLDLGAALAVREAAIIAKRTKRGKEAGAMAGRPHGAVNYGYRIEYDPQSGKPLRRVQVPEEAAIIREIARRILAGETLSSVARDLTDRGVPTPREGKGDRDNGWNAGNMGRLVRAPALAGLRVYNDAVLPDVTCDWEPILTIDQHQRLTQLLSDPSRKTVRNGSHTRWLLSGIGECGVCGGPVRVVSRVQRTGAKTFRYQCRPNHCVARIAADVDDIVERVIVEVLSREDLPAVLAADDPTVTAASEELARLRARLDEAQQLATDGELSMASLAAVEQRIGPRIERLEREARPRHVSSVVLDASGPQAAELWAKLDVRERREIIRTLARVVIKRTQPRDGWIPFDAGSVEITPRF